MWRRTPAPIIATSLPRPARQQRGPAATGTTAGADAGDGEIDIEALLALEAELEGGTSAPVPAAAFERHTVSPSPVALPALPDRIALDSLAPDPDPIALEPFAADADVDARAEVEPALDAIAQERLDLERQFAALVDTVAPADDASVHLIPETPLTSEPLVDARVLWSSMPAEVTDLAPTSVDSDAADTAHAVPAGGVAVDEEPDDAAAILPNDAPEHVADVVVDVTPEAREVFAWGEPVVAAPPDDPLRSTPIEHAPSAWWRAALPWRVEEQATAVAESIPDGAAAVRTSATCRSRTSRRAPRMSSPSAKSRSTTSSPIRRLSRSRCWRRSRPFSRPPTPSTLRCRYSTLMNWSSPTPACRSSLPTTSPLSRRSLPTNPWTSRDVDVQADVDTLWPHDRGDLHLDRSRSTDDAISADAIGDLPAPTHGRTSTPSSRGVGWPARHARGGGRRRRHPT